MCPENVDSEAVIDCSSPMSASTSANTGSRARSAGTWQPALVQQRAQAERLEGDGLAAGVGAAQHQHAHAPQGQVDRDDRRGIQQRVARRDQLHVIGRLDGAAAPAARERAAREREVDRGQHLDGARELVRVGSDAARQLGQDARDLVALVALELAQPVRQLDDRERLDEQRLPRVARVVDDARDGVARARADGDHGPARRAPSRSPPAGAAADRDPTRASAGDRSRGDGPSRAPSAAPSASARPSP